MLQTKDTDFQNVLKKKKGKTWIYAAYDTHYRSKDKYSIFRKCHWKWEDVKRYSKHKKKNARAAILIWDKIAFKIKTIIKEKWYYICSRESIQEKYITIVNIYAPKTGAPHIRQKLTNIKGETYKSMVIMWTLTDHLPQWTDWATEHAHRALRPKATENTSFQVHMEQSPRQTMC